MAMRIILMLAAGAVPVLLGIACHACREERRARFDPTTGRWVARLVVTTRWLVLAWGGFGWWAVFLSPRPWSPSVLIPGLAGLLFACCFNVPIFLGEWLASRPKPRIKPSRHLASNGPLWDAELDH
jgi:hypothetical protein